jgi:hypothetical protein
VAKTARYREGGEIKKFKTDYSPWSWMESGLQPEFVKEHIANLEQIGYIVFRHLDSATRLSR